MSRGCFWDLEHSIEKKKESSPNCVDSFLWYPPQKKTYKTHIEAIIKSYSVPSSKPWFIPIFLQDARQKLQSRDWQGRFPGSGSSAGNSQPYPIPHIGCVLYVCIYEMVSFFLLLCALLLFCFVLQYCFVLCPSNPGLSIFPLHYITLHYIHTCIYVHIRAYTYIYVHIRTYTYILLATVVFEQRVYTAMVKWPCVFSTPSPATDQKSG